jgi:PTS system glucitol/sorbitol-specific IIA component
MNETATGSALPDVRYETTVTAVGDQVAPLLATGIVVLFREDSPAELHDISVLHRPTVQLGGPEPGDMIEIGEHRVEVLAVGGVVADNLLNLGHLDLKANDERVAKLPGDVCVPKGGLSMPAVGDTIRIVRNGGQPVPR